ncbi:transporter family-2 protein [Bisgaardia hudsonensis]|uniref:Transporter family-2 protein n=1 Tax=Bisgaardia hudsonensis TaxID=109472 RepID=A0A4R2MX84_9PAST|nr:DMT family transporter [Bisgaardia hudsonensis]QLB13859.1 hypothetical protein A6A11_09665 [Bisgaardia hudsonensis]TCP11656.1 transporter family-2 protein [Bisgaardia hudsonensis]
MLISFIFIAFFAGLAFATQSAINSQLASTFLNQPIVAALMSFLVGTIVLLIICLIKVDFISTFQHFPRQSWWKLIGGVLGAFAVIATIFLAPKMGITNMLFFIIIGQLIGALVIDHFGLIGMPKRPMDLWQLLGFFTVALGLAIFFFGKKWFI